MSQHHSSARRSSLTLLAIVLCAFARPASAQTTLTVNTANDSNDGSCTNALCSLRDALQATQSSVGGSLFTIVFDPTVFSTPQTITLNSDLPWIGLQPTNSSVAIQGPGANLLTISGNGAYNVFTMYGPVLNISGVTIANANNPNQSGGAIYTFLDTNMNISHCVFNGNSAAGGGAILQNGGNLTITDSAFSGNSAGIDDGGAIAGGGGSLTISNSTFDGNSAELGGALFIFAEPLTITNSKFLGNSASGVSGNEGGAIFSAGGLSVSNSTVSGNSAGSDGGAIYMLEEPANIRNSTITGNSAMTGSGGAFFNLSGSLTVTNSTISGNSAGQSGTGGSGGAIAEIQQGIMAPTLIIGNNVFSGNSVSRFGVGGALYIQGGPVTDSNNVFFNNTGGDIIGGALSSTDRTGNDTMLAVLGEYGGPTQTMIPLPGSAAICAGSISNIPSGVTTDQRGYPNSNSDYEGYTAGEPCVDAGAVQTNYALNFSTEPPTSVSAGASFSAAVTLDESGAPFAGDAVTIPLSLAGGDNGALSNGSATTANSVANYSNLSVSAAGTGDVLVANLTLNSASTPAAAVLADSDPFDAAAGAEAQTITFNNPGAQSVGTPIALVATASSGLTVSFASNTSSVCAVSGQGATFPMAGTCSITASQPGNGTYAAATPVTQSFNVTALARSLTIGGTAVTVSPGENTGNTSTITVTPVGGFTGSVTLSAVITSSPAGAQFPPTLSFGSSSPVNITGASSGTATLTIDTKAATSGALEYPAWPAGRRHATGGAALACLLLFGLSARRRRWRTMVGMLALMAALIAGPLSCGGGSTGGGGGGGGGSPGTTAGNYTISVTGTSGTITNTGTVALTVE